MPRACFSANVVPHAERDRVRRHRRDVHRPRRATIPRRAALLDGEGAVDSADLHRRRHERPRQGRPRPDPSSSPSSTARRSPPTPSSSAAARRPASSRPRASATSSAPAAPTARTSSTRTGIPRPPLVPRRHILEVSRAGRLRGHRARASSTRTTSAPRRRKFKARGIESVAISYLNSFMNPDARAADQGDPRARARAGRLRVHLVGVLPEMREFERTSTVAANAYLMPVIERYLDGLVEALRDVGLRGRGLRHALRRRHHDRARRPAVPARICHSGPPAESSAARSSAEMAGFDERHHPRHGRHERRPLARRERRAPIALANGASTGTSRSCSRPSTSWRSARAAARSRGSTTGGSLRVGPQSAGADARSRVLRPGQRPADHHRRPPLPRAAESRATYLGGDMTDRRPALAEAAIERTRRPSSA